MGGCGGRWRWRWGGKGGGGSYELLADNVVLFLRGFEGELEGRLVGLLGLDDLLLGFGFRHCGLVVVR